MQEVSLETLIRIFEVPEWMVSIPILLDTIFGNGLILVHISILRRWSGYLLWILLKTNGVVMLDIWLLTTGIEQWWRISYIQQSSVLWLRNVSLLLVVIEGITDKINQLSPFSFSPWAFINHVILNILHQFSLIRMMRSITIELI